MNEPVETLAKVNREVNPSPAQTVRFWKKVNKNGPIPHRYPELGPCWIWTAAKDPHGYGRVRIGGKTLLSHRVGWVLEIGTIQDGLHALHKCDNPSCIRGTHLFLGTDGDNVLDSVRKERHAPKLTWEDVCKIRAMDGFMCHRRIAEIFGVHRSMIWLILNNKEWTIPPTSAGSSQL